MILANRRKGLREILRQILEVAKDGCFGSKRTLAHKLDCQFARQPALPAVPRRGGQVTTTALWRNWRGHDDVMHTRSIRGSGEPFGSHYKVRANDWDPIRA